MKKILTCLLLISILTACFVVGLFALSVVKDDKEFNEVTTEVTKNIDDKTDDTQKGSSTKKDDTKSEPTVAPQQENTDDAVSFQPHAVKSTKPSKYMKMTQINVNGKTLSNNKKYRAKQEISFEQGSEYTAANGIVTFRGNNFRDNPVWGTADFAENKLKSDWTYQTRKTYLAGENVDRQRLDRTASRGQMAACDKTGDEYAFLGERGRFAGGSDLCLPRWTHLFSGYENR